MSSGKPLRCVAWIALALLAVTAVCAAPAARRPNVLLVLADDLGFGDVQALNPERGRIPTPQLDRLAAQGMTFTDAHSGASVCTPTRYGLLTGRHAWRTRLQQGVIEAGNDTPLIAPEILTLPEMLRAQGYATACIGKWHLGFASTAAPGNGWTGRGPGRDGLPVGARTTDDPTTHGFDVFRGISHARTMVSLHDGDRVTELIEPVDLMPRLVRRAQEQLETAAAGAREGRPFFLYVALTAPHTPLVPAAAWQRRSPLGPYGDFVQQTDAAVGELLATLDRLQLAERTLVIFASDNGCAVQAGVEQLEAQGHFASGPYRGYKADIWEGGHRVPFFVRWPGVVAAGSRVAEPIGLTDIMATLAEALAVTLPPHAAPDSASFLAALQGRPLPADRPALVHHSREGTFAVRQGPWKLILGGGSGGYGKPSNADAAAAGLPDAQLYRLADDPGERTNRIATDRAEARRLAALLRRYVADGRSTPGPTLANDVAVTLPTPAALRAGPP